MKKLLLISITIVLTIGLILGGCAKTTPATTAPAPTATAPTATAPKTTAPTATAPPTTPPTIVPKSGGVLRILYNVGAVGSIGWPPEYKIGNIDHLQYCFEPLLHGDNKGGVYPWLAESYKLADDLKSVTFTLRKDVKFQDGSDFNAEVAKWNLDNQIAAKNQPKWASVDIIDNYTIRVNLTEWQNTILYTFVDDTPSWMVSKAAFDKNGIDWVRNNPVGTGPFKLASYVPSVSMKWVRNPDYWQKGKPYLDEIDMTVVQDSLTREAAMQAGEGDIAIAAKPKEVADMAAFGLTAVANFDTIMILSPDTANPDSPWANQKVREAVEYAINRDTIAKAYGYGFAQAPYQIPPRGSVVYNPNFTLGRKYDPDKAKQLLAEAGYSNGLQTAFICGATIVDKNICVAIQADLAKVGIQVELQFPEAGGFVTADMGTWHNAAIMKPFPPFANLNQSLSFTFLPSSLHKSWLRTPEFTEALNATLASRAPDVNLMRAVTDLLTRDASIIPLNEGVRGWMIKPYVMNGGFYTRSQNVCWNPEQVWLNK